MKTKTAIRMASLRFRYRFRWKAKPSFMLFIPCHFCAEESLDLSCITGVFALGLQDVAHVFGKKTDVVDVDAMT